MNNRLSHLFVIRKHMLLAALGLAIGYIAVAMLGIFTGDLIDSMLNVQAADGIWQKLGLLFLLSLVTLCLSFFRSCPEKWCKQAFQVFKRSAVISYNIVAKTNSERK